MFLTITTTHPPATDLGYLLHKHPQRLHTAELPFGTVQMFYPQATEQRCTFALVLEVDPVALVRREGDQRDRPFSDEYVNDRPYAASSFLSVAIARCLGSALNGRSRERPDLALQPLAFEATIAPLPARGGEDFLRRLFEPLGYAVRADGAALAERFPEWGASPYFAVTLERVCTLSELLSHLYVLIPVLDNRKHYWVGDDEVEKLLRKAERWLGGHPEREVIVRRYLKHRRHLTREVLARLSEEDHSDPDAEQAARADEEQELEAPVRLADLRMEAVARAVLESEAKSVLDLGCGEGRLLKRLSSERTLERVVGVDVSVRALEIAAERLKLERPQRSAPSIELIHGALTYRDARLAGFDAATAVEVIEHLDPSRLTAFERVLFHAAHPRVIVMTTPNIEYNALFAGLPAGRLRHRDHRFEWTRADFHAWAEAAASRHGYTVEFRPVGEEDPALGPPTQMGVFRLCS